MTTSEDVVVVNERPMGERLGQFIMRERKARDLRQVDLATQADVALSVLQNIEQGKIRHPTKATMRKLADALGLRMIDLWIGAGEIDPDELGLDDSADPQWRRLQALWRALSPDDRGTVMVLAEGMFARNRERAD